ncbi:hypothetical protein [Enterobacter kobei]|uniref:hypothetical protein n=1 Tax=Enterobacter kobei TaxID=208224 RepID=UPI000AAAE4B8|nr:hypothetical protein [Enterobacter kobei]
MALTHLLQQNPVNGHQRFPDPADTMANASDALRSHQEPIRVLPLPGTGTCPTSR